MSDSKIADPGGHKKIAFLLGIEMRSGTNYLYNLVSKHPHCEVSGEIWEDYCLADIKYLKKYFSVLWEFWRGYEPKRVTREGLVQGIENIISELLHRQNASESNRLLLSKTPATVGIDELATCFPNTKTVFLVRDGRSVAYSLSKSFGVGYFEALDRWKNGCRNILRFRDQHKEYFERNCLLVSYENVFRKSEESLRRVFEFLGLDPQEYDYEEADNSPVIGSSDLRDKSDEVNWSKVKKYKDFNPLGRYMSWPKWKRSYSDNYLADELEALGYETNRTFSPRSLVTSIVHWLLRVANGLKPRSLKRKIKRRMLQS